MDSLRQMNYQKLLQHEDFKKIRIRKKKSKNKSPKPEKVLSYNLCCLKRSDRPEDEPPSFHFHEWIGFNYLRDDKTIDTCTPAFGKIYGPIELAFEGVRLKILKDEE